LIAATLDETCALACAEAFRGDGEVLASPMGAVPKLGARLAQATFSPDLLLTDGESRLVRGASGGRDGVVEGWMPYRRVFNTLWAGRRHVMMGASQIDQYGNTNISCVGEHARPRVQLLGVRGAPGNTICHTTSYFLGDHRPRVFVPSVDFVSGVGYDRAARLGAAASRFHEIRVVISRLGVFDFRTPDRRMRLASVHPGVTVREVVAATGFDLVVPHDVPTTREPDSEQLSILRTLVEGGDGQTPVEFS